MRDGENKAGVEAELGLLAKAENVTDAMPADSEALRLESAFAYQVLMVTVKTYCFFWEAAFIELGDLYELHKGCTFSEKVSTVLFDAP